MKKLFSVLMMIMVLTCAVSVFAAESLEDAAEGLNTAATIDEHGKTITIRFPNMIGHNTFDENSFEIFDIKNYMFTKAALKAYQEARQENDKVVKEKAEEDGIYTKAYNNLENILTNQVVSFLNAADVDSSKYTIEIIVDDQSILFSES